MCTAVQYRVLIVKHTAPFVFVYVLYIIIKPYRQGSGVLLGSSYSCTPQWIDHTRSAGKFCPLHAAVSESVQVTCEDSSGIVECRLREMIEGPKPLARVRRMC